MLYFLLSLKTTSFLFVFLYKERSHRVTQPPAQPQPNPKLTNTHIQQGQNFFKEEKNFFD